MLRYVGTGLIRGYQRHLSPRKGYRCAYGVLHGSGTCSSVGLEIMRSQGVLAFLRLMPLQFDTCRTAVATLKLQSEQDKHRKKKDEDGMDCSDFDAPQCAQCMEIADCEFASCD